jgi:hypothetical protein
VFTLGGLLEAIDKRGIGLRAEFGRTGRRMAHRIAAVIGAEVVPLLASCEGEDLEAFPPSPPLQQLALDPRGDDLQVALLVGMAGRSHWSVSVEAFASRRVLRFDVACRSPSAESTQLGSSYHATGAWQFLDDGTSGRRLVRAGYLCRLWACAERDVRARVTGEAENVSIHPVGLPRNGTWRWRYDVALEPVDSR